MRTLQHRHDELARLSPAWLVFCGTLALFIILVVLLNRTGQRPSKPAAAPLVVYCAAGIKAPVEQVAKEYEQACGQPIQLSYGGSQTLLASLEVSRRGDLYLPADESYVALARKKGLAAETIPLATMTAVVAVKKGNPKNLQSLTDLLQPGVLLAQANPEAAAIGQLTRHALQQAGSWPAVEAKTKVFHGTVSEVANDVQIGTVDAGFVWDALAAQDPDLESVELPELKSARAKITIAVLPSTTQPTAALRFARYLGARDKGLLAFASHGYRPVAGDLWAESPELRLFSGAMLRPALEQTLAEFERREGIRIRYVYNGCGILVSQMRAGERPDAYFSCDQSFMNQVHDLFLDAEDISMNQLVILVPKGNPRQLRCLADLKTPGLRLGLAHEKQSALGALTKTLLEKSELYDGVRKNMAVESATGDFLVNQLRTGSLDAVIVYRSNAAASSAHLEAISIEQPEAMTIQPVAVGRASDHQQLASRLVDAIKTAQSKERFLSLGFSWRAGLPQPTNHP